MKSREFRERLLVALVSHARATDAGGFLDPPTIADRAGLERNQGQLRIVVDDLDARGLANVSHTMGGGDEGGLHLRLTNAAFEEAEALLEEHPEYAGPATLPAAPAADRYVVFSHNQREPIAASLDELRRALRHHG